MSEFLVIGVLKVDNGFRGVIRESDVLGRWKRGDEFFNRAFKPYPTGSLLNVTVLYTPAGRKFVKNIEVVTGRIGAAVVPDAGTETGRLVEKKRSKPVATGKLGYYVGSEARLTFSTALRISQAKPDKAVKLMMVGPSGYGKTTLPKIFAERVGKKFLRMNCATVRDPEEWFGYREAVAGSTVFVRSQFAKALEEGNLVVVLDEFNRLEPWLHNTLFPLLDDDGCTVVHDEEFRIGPGVIVVGTINTGYKYTGTFELDEALFNRFDFVLEVGPIPHNSEVKVLEVQAGVDRGVAVEIVKMGNILRTSDIVCSTRTTLRIAAMVVAGMTVREAFETAVIRRITSDSNGGLRKTAIDLVNANLGVNQTRELDYDVFEGYENEAVEPLKVEEVSSTTLRLRRATGPGPGPAVGVVQAIILLRSLKLNYELTQKAAQGMVKNIVEGSEVTLQLAEAPADIHQFEKEFASVGIEARLFE